MRAGNLIDERLVDEMIDAWVDWREESAAVWDAYQRWVEAPVEDAPLAFCTYRGALEREEYRCRLYAEAMRQVANGAQQRRGGSPGAARVQRGTPGRQEAPDLRRGLSSCLRGEHGTACYALALIGGCAPPTLLLMALISTL